MDKSDIVAGALVAAIIGGVVVLGLGIVYGIVTVAKWAWGG